MNGFGKLVFGAVSTGVAWSIYKFGVKNGREDAKKDRHNILIKLSKSICNAYSQGNQEQAHRRGLLKDGVGNIDWHEGGIDGIEFMQQQLKHGPLQMLEDMGLIYWTKTEYRG